MNSARLTVHVTPRAASNRVVRDGDTIRAWVHAAPADGEANEALLRVLAKALEVPRSRLSIVRGHASRVKIVAVEGLTAADVLARVPEGSPA